MCCVVLSCDLLCIYLFFYFHTRCLPQLMHSSKYLFFKRVLCLLVLSFLRLTIHQFIYSSLQIDLFPHIRLLDYVFLLRPCIPKTLLSEKVKSRLQSLWFVLAHSTYDKTNRKEWSSHEEGCTLGRGAARS